MQRVSGHCGSRPGGWRLIASAFCSPRVTCRRGNPFADTGLDSLTIGGLDTAEAVALVEEFAHSRVQAAVARTLAEAGRADPLWLREAARELSPDERSGAAPLNERFRGPASVQQGFVRLAHGLSVEARQALVALAADEHAPARVMHQALAGLGIGDGAIRAGIDCGLAHLEAGRPRFSHPLARTAALEIADPIQRRLAHAALARAWDAEGEFERATWHLAETATGRTHASPLRWRVSHAPPGHAAPQVRRRRRGSGRSTPPRTRTTRSRCGSSARGISPRRGGPARRSARSSGSSIFRARRSSARIPRSCRGSS